MAPIKERLFSDTQSGAHTIYDCVCPALSKGTKKGTLSENNRFLKGALESDLYDSGPCLSKIQRKLPMRVGISKKFMVRGP